MCDVRQAHQVNGSGTRERGGGMEEYRVYRVYSVYRGTVQSHRRWSVCNCLCDLFTRRRQHRTELHL